MKLSNVFDASALQETANRIAALPRGGGRRLVAGAGAAAIGPECDVAIVEGNYLLFDESPWSALAPLWDISAWLEVPETVLRERSVRRWLDHDHTPESALARAEGNDLPNARRIALARLPAGIAHRN